MDHVSEALANLLSTAAEVRGGAPADYIPELASADPDEFGVAIVSVHGRLYAAGHSSSPFTIQSISKPFVYALAVTELGFDEVARRVGFEPSGEPFNAISLEPGTGRPANPMINAGAIVTSALVPGTGPAERFETVRRTLSAFAGRELAVDERVFASEMATGDRNRALAYLTAAAEVLPRSVEDAVEVYFRQCSVLVTAADLAAMGATLANAGVNPLSGETVVDESVARHTLSLMASCGMYDYSGEWLVRVGLPAKSGVGGGIVAVQPAQFGIGVYSPPLDARGNSTRGVAALVMLSDHYGLHLLDHPTSPRSPIESAASAGDELVVSLRGEIDFISVEEVVHHLEGLHHRGAGEGDVLRLDLTDVTRLRPVAERLLAVTVRDLRDEGIGVEIVDPGRVITGVTTVDGATLVRDR